MLYHPSWAVAAHKLPRVLEQILREVFTVQNGHPVYELHLSLVTMESLEGLSL